MNWYDELIRISGAYNIPLRELMELTPAELRVLVEEKQRVKNDEIVISAWLTAAFSRAKRLPKIDKFISQPRTRTIDPLKAKADFEELKARLERL